MRGFWKYIPFFLVLVVFSVEGQWDTWSNWSVCDVPCGGGSQNRTRICNITSVNCTADDVETQSCNNISCAHFCPITSFACNSGGLMCISRSLICDCNNDCADGSDETNQHAGCTSLALAACAPAVSDSSDTEVEKVCSRCYTAYVACSLVLPLAFFTLFQLYKIYRVLV